MPRPSVGNFFKLGHFRFPVRQCSEMWTTDKTVLFIKFLNCSSVQISFWKGTKSIWLVWSIRWKTLFTFRFSGISDNQLTKSHLFLMRVSHTLETWESARENELLEQILALELIDQFSKCFVARVFWRILADMRYLSCYCSNFSCHRVGDILQALIWQP